MDLPEKHIWRFLFNAPFTFRTVEIAADWWREPAVMQSAGQLVNLWRSDLNRRQVDRQSGQDRRKFDDTKTVQAEAIAPNILVQFLDDEITSRLDMAVYLGALEAEAELRAEVDLILKQVG